MEKTEKKPMLKRVLERLNDEATELSSTQEKLRLKQKQIADKLLNECLSQGLIARLKVSIVKDEPMYTIELSYDLGDSYVSRFTISPVFASLGKDQDKHPVHFHSYYTAQNKRMLDVANLFRDIEEDMYHFYKHK